MKRKFAKPCVLLLFMMPLALFAQGEPTADVANAPSWLLSLIAKWPVLSTVIVIIGGLRILVKPFVAFAHWVADRTDTPKDNEWIERVENSKFLKTLSFVLDWFASVKLVRK